MSKKKLSAWEQTKANFAKSMGWKGSDKAAAKVNNQALIDRENKMFPNFSAAASAFAGPASEPRFGMFSGIADTFGAEHDAQGNRVNPIVMSNQEAAANGQPHLAPKLYVDPLFQNAPDVNPQALAAAHGKRVAPAPNYEPQQTVQAPVRAPVQAPPVQAQRAPAQVDIPFEQRGMYVPDRQVRADVHNIMDFDKGLQGRGYEW